MPLKVGKKAPEFSIPNQHNETITLASLKGKKVVLYFYPKDNTPTCTEEACNLRDNYKLLQKNGYVVYGISPDSVKKHQNFISKFDLPFDLLSDTELTMVNKYKVWAEKTLYGRKYMGVLRTTYIINEEGVIEEVIEKVTSKDHTSQILK
ncbi:MAG: thioredoxin-dependent thiol peroxidase [Bacteroidia bacterium]|nr:thioredoxin-dependent thiol peroxidase [Bacteroidia bacterium]